MPLHSSGMKHPCSLRLARPLIVAIASTVPHRLSSRTGAFFVFRLVLAVATLLVPSVAPETTADGGQECWEHSQGDIQAVGRCLQSRLGTLLEQPSLAATRHARSLMPHVARAAAALSSTGDLQFQQSAVVLLDTALNVEFFNPNLHFLRGNALAALGQSQLAAEAFVSAITYVPVHVDALHNYAAIIMDLPARSAEQSRAALRALQVGCETICVGKQEQLAIWENGIENRIQHRIPFSCLSVPSFAIC